MAFQAFPQVVGISFGHSASLAVLFWWDGREFFCSSGKDIAISLLQVLVFFLGQLLAFSFGDNDAGRFEQTFHIGRPGVTVGVHNKG